MYLNNGLKVKVKSNVEVELEGITQGVENPNTLEVHKDKVYTLHCADLYSEGKSLVDIYSLNTVEGYELERFGFSIESANGTTVTLKDKEGKVADYSILPTNYKSRGNVSNEFKKGNYHVLFMEDATLGTKPFSYSGTMYDRHDINVAYSVFAKYFEIVGIL